MPLFLAVAVVIFGHAPVKRLGLIWPTDLLAVIVASGVVWIPIYILVVRYRLRSTPPSFRG